MTDTATPSTEALDAEAALIGAALRDPNRHLAAVLDTPADRWTDLYHRRIADGIADLHRAGTSIDPHTIASHLEFTTTEQSRLNQVLGAGWITNVDSYRAVIDHQWRKRQTAALLAEAATLAAAGETDTALTVAQRAVDLETVGQRRRLTYVPDAIDEHLSILESRSEGTTSAGIRTRWVDVDRILGPLRPGQLVTIAGRPAMGKSAVAAALAINVAAAGVPALTASIEMGLDELLDRYYANLSRIGSTYLRDGKLAQRDWEHIAKATGVLADLPLHVLDDPDATLASIRSAATRSKAGLVIVDYLQLMTPASRRENRQVEVSEISAGLKRLARDLEVPVIALAQLNRGLELRSDKRPQLSDLRESGAIENDSDVVIGLYRDEVYHPESKDQGVLEIHVLKQRNGPTGKARLAYLTATNTITDLAAHI